MIRTNLLAKIKFFTVALFLTFTSLLLTAQQRGADFSVEVEDQAKGPGAESFMSNPLLLVIGALILVTAVVFILKGRRK